MKRALATLAGGPVIEMALTLTFVIVTVNVPAGTGTPVKVTWKPETVPATVCDPMTAAASVAPVEAFSTSLVTGSVAE
jgi:hypothetical protein